MKKILIPFLSVALACAVVAQQKRPAPRPQPAVFDLAELQAVLSTLKRLDPKRERITLVPAADTATDEVVRWMDAVRRGPEGELFPRVILQAVATP